ncbi:MAG: molecular chaperone DnaJ [Brevundimonas sp. 32-68-21]|jgi:DnaJ-domain-containing protein 1|uniref:Molecular chaperone DnaJ n=1 Tax=Brevundimonas mediterranea TaxID=74329 RepID=A0AB37E8F6_9CAUL|nr:MULTISPECIES: molecular chaperone DnaJ [Brevundimonas]EDX80280.1 DnaJ domain protein [Brevundimonas sp. BAL3]MBA4331316.1 molecular chaperone DnaJ [Brevundimonas sp.]OYX80975.1 MAG: molecular chaperone DnaJ [Brevundimonas sp. 32-68-21]QIH73806.1 molecular chaperone DnaJ [Brevundimonas mediterranea]
MSLIWLALAAIAVWALVRLGRQTERRGRAHWRVTATLLGSVLLAGGALSAFRGAWLWAGVLATAGLYLAWSSRIRPVVRSEPISEADARAVLGVRPGATEAEIRTAWKKAMGRAHPDQGGTEGLATRVNAARDRLLRKTGRD